MSHNYVIVWQEYRLFEVDVPRWKHWLVSQANFTPKNTIKDSLNFSLILFL